MGQWQYLKWMLNSMVSCFITYAFVGWCIETAYMAVFLNRFRVGGFFIFPLRPIYGFGALLVLFLLKTFRHNPLLVFTGAFLLTSFLEYLTGLMLRQVFHRTLWNYRHEFLNLNGMICLKFSIGWALLTLFLMYLFQPLAYLLFRHVPGNLKTLLAYSVLFLFLFHFFLHSIQWTGGAIRNWITGRIW